MAYTHITQENKAIKISNRTKNTLDYVKKRNEYINKRVKQDRDKLIEEKTANEVHSIIKPVGVFITNNPIAR